MADNTEAAAKRTQGADEPNKQMAPRRRAVSWLGAMRNATSNALRYLVITALFLYLLTAILLFHNIMAFHDRVSSEVGDDSRARRVVLMVNRIHENPDIFPPGEKQLPVGALAVTLGKLQSTYTDLSRFRDFSIAQPDGDDIAAAESKTDKVLINEELLNEFEQLRETLNEDVDGLHQYVTENNGDAAIIHAVNEFRNREGCFEAPVRASEGLVCLENDLAEFRNAIVDASDGFVAYDAFSKIQSIVDDGIDLETIEPHEFMGHMDRLAESVKQLSREMASYADTETERAQIEGSVQQIAQWTTPPLKNQAIPGLSAEFADMRTAVTLIGKDLPIDPLTPVIHAAFAAMNERISRFKSEPRMLPEIDNELNAITSELKLRFPNDFEVAETIVEQIGNLRSDMPKLQDITPATYQAADGKITVNDDAKQFYEQRLEAIGSYMTEMEEKLKKQGRTIALANVIRENENETELSATTKADGILQDFDALNRFGALLMPFSTWIPARHPISQFGLNPPRLATLTTDSITTIYVLLIGAFGSLLYITRFQLKQVLQGHLLTMSPRRPLSWFLFRPIFGVGVALALYFMMRAGQMALGSGEGGEVGTTLNIWFLSALALFAGILSWDALRMIETRGQNWFRSQARQPLWASGLGNALRMRGITEAECAERIGRSEEQVNRWLAFKDRVPEEMQDRILTWLDMRPDELFGEEDPSEGVSGKPLWAIGLRDAMDNSTTRLDAEALVLMLGEEKRDDNVKRTKDWIALKKQVPPATQWRLVHLLGAPHHRLFAEDISNRPVWGVELRRVMEKEGETAQDIADHLNVSVKTVHDWKELETPIPVAMCQRLMEHLKCTFSELFEPDHPGRHQDFYKVPLNMRGALEKRSISLKDFADDIDVDVGRVEKWCDDNEKKRGSIAKPTREKIEDILTSDGPDPFLPPPPELTDQRSGDGGDGTNPVPPSEPFAGGKKPRAAVGIAEAMKKRGFESAEALARDKELYGLQAKPENIKRVRGWVDQTIQVSWDKQQPLIDALRTTNKDLFG